MRFKILLFVLLLISPSLGRAEDPAETKVGLASSLTGDFAVMGENLKNTLQTYEKHYLRHPLKFFYEDAKISSTEGLQAYQKLINGDHVDILIGGTTSNGTLAGKSLINSSKTVLITPLTGGSNIDAAGPYIYRIGNSDILNGYEQSAYFLEHQRKRIALFTEETEYTVDIADHFKKDFLQKGGEIVFEQTFLPQTTDFRTLITLLQRKHPQALFMSTQSGLAFGLFLKQFREMNSDKDIEIHTNFVAAANPDAFAAAGDAIYGVHYLAPRYDKENPELKKFFAFYKSDHGLDPSIAFHTAGTVDALNLLQDFLDHNKKYETEAFREFLQEHVQNYKGLMGTYSFDAEGNARLGFEEAIIEKKN